MKRETNRQLSDRILGDVRDRLAPLSPALEIARLAAEYGRAKAEGRTDDARAIKAAAMALKAAELGVEYDVFCQEQAAYVAAERPALPQAVAEAEAALDALDASLNAWIGATREAELRTALAEADGAIQGEAAGEPSPIARAEQLLVEADDLHSRLWHLRSAAIGRPAEYMRLDRAVQRARERSYRRQMAVRDAEWAAAASPRVCIHCGDPVGFGDTCAACAEDAGSAVLAA